tara:strand:+ start:306 stop:500 length:195 start_codon:yes stop_codon:yes gene_type:complete
MEASEKYEIQIENYITWLIELSPNKSEELRWLIDLLLNSKHKKDMINVLETLNQGYVSDSNNKF